MLARKFIPKIIFLNNLITTKPNDSSSFSMLIKMWYFLFDNDNVFLNEIPIPACVEYHSKLIMLTVIYNHLQL